MPPAQPTSGDDREKGGLHPCSGRGGALRRSDVGNSISVLGALKAALGDGIIHVRNVSIEVVEIWSRSVPALQSAVTARAFTSSRKKSRVTVHISDRSMPLRTLDPHLHRRDAGARFRKVAVATRQGLRLRTFRRRHQNRHRESGRYGQPDKCNERDYKTLEQGPVPAFVVAPVHQP